jgi:hypothetical protein
MNDKPIRSSTEVVQAVSATGSHFFSKNTMRSFRSRLSSRVYPTAEGCYFVTSEQDHGVCISSGWVPGAYDGKRRYTIRFVAAKDITVTHPRYGKSTYQRGELMDTADDAFSKYGSASGAHDAAKRMQAQPHPEVNGE